MQPIVSHGLKKKKKVRSALYSQIEMGLAPPRIVLTEKPARRAHLEGRVGG